MMFLWIVFHKIISCLVESGLAPAHLCGQCTDRACPYPFVANLDIHIKNKDIRKGCPYDNLPARTRPTSTADSISSSGLGMMPLSEFMKVLYKR